MQEHERPARDSVDVGAEGLTSAPTWFDVVRDVSDHVVPARADWVVLHVRDRVIELIRQGNAVSLADAGIGAAQTGEGLSLVLLRHHDGELEVAMHHLVQALSPRVGDPYGVGRVIETGISRLASVVDSAHLHALTTDTCTLAMLEQLDLGGTVIAPVVAAGVVIGSLTLAHSPGSAIPRDERAAAEELGRSIGAALDASRPATAEAIVRCTPAHRQLRWTPPEQGNPVASARSWVRRVLPDVLDEPVRADLGDDLDLVLSELAGNAIRHGGELGAVTVGLRDSHVHVAVFDREDRPPTLRTPQLESDSGRGLLLVSALSEHWSVDHDAERGGKAVWAELRI